MLKGEKSYDNELKKHDVKLDRKKRTPRRANSMWRPSAIPSCPAASPTATDDEPDRRATVALRTLAVPGIPKTEA